VADALVVEQLGKQFRRYHPERATTLQEAVVRGGKGVRSAERFWALRDVSFAVPAGRTVGIIGANGAGKSTLLRLAAGVGRPDEGRVETHGRIGALLDLSSGFHPDLTGRDNVQVNGVVAGLTRREVAARFDAIVAFAELEDAIDNPLYTYSSGMQMRLGFAVAIHVDPEILFIDEVLAVGDIAFQQKCLQRIAQLRAQGRTIVVASHQADLVQDLCDEVIWLAGGRLVEIGPPADVVGRYVSEMMVETRRRTPAELPASAPGANLRMNENRLGSLELEITAVRLLDRNDVSVAEVCSGEPFRIELDYVASRPVCTPIFSIAMSREDGVLCWEANTAAAGLTLPTIEGRGRISLDIERLDLNGGCYLLDVGAYAADWRYAYDYHWHAYPLRVRNSGSEKGLLRPPQRWEMRGV
jgi:lipopolysaccharide transport system ATP-binding protein